MHSARPKFFYFLLFAFPVICVVAILALYAGTVSRQAKSQFDLRIEGDWPITADEVVGFVAAKNSTTLRQHLRSGLSYRLITDSRGARVNGSDQPTPKQVDILTIGGSFSWGHGVENEYTFTENLRHQLGVNVANFAYGSYGTVQSLQLLGRNSDLKPKVIVYGFISDHLRRNVTPCAPSYAPYCLPVSHVASDDGGELRIMAPVTQYSAEQGRAYFNYVKDKSIGLADVKWGVLALTSRIQQRTAWAGSDDSRNRRDAMSMLLRRIEEQADRLNAVLVVVHIPSLGGENIESAPSELTQALGEKTLFVDVSDAVRTHYEDPDNPLLRFEKDGHPNELAHEMIAEEISEVLKAANVY